MIDDKLHRQPASRVLLSVTWGEVISEYAHPLACGQQKMTNCNYIYFLCLSFLQWAASVWVFFDIMCREYTLFNTYKVFPQASRYESQNMNLPLWLLCWTFVDSFQHRATMTACSPGVDIHPASGSEGQLTVGLWIKEKVLLSHLYSHRLEANISSIRSFSC